MKRLFIVLIIIVHNFTLSYAQVPYFSNTPGNRALYGYTSLKVRPGVNKQETYTCFQYGIGDNIAVGTDVYTGVRSSYWGFLIRAGKVFNPYFGIGGQVTPSFDLNNSFKYSYTTAAIYMNGQITKDGKLFWCSNTWFGINKGADNTFSNWEYLGYTISLPNGRSITPLLGCIHDWKFREDADLAIGGYYSIGKFNIYLMGNDFFKKNPRVVAGVDFKLSAGK